MQCCMDSLLLKDSLHLMTKDFMNNLFFELIQVAIGTRIHLSRTPSEAEWGELYAMAKKQSLVGICFAGVQRLQQQRQSPESMSDKGEMLYLTWMGMAAKIQQRNEVMNKYTEKTVGYFKSKGVACSILEGQAVAKLYGDLAGLRQSGDVDVWLDCSRKELFELSKKEFGRVEGYNGFHIHYPLYDDCEIEAHFTPGHFSSLVIDRRFPDFCRLHKPKFNDVPLIGSGQAQSINPEPYTINLPFNLVYIMQHCYNHLCGHGVGLRQVMDYYFVLLAANKRVSEGSIVSEGETMEWIEHLSMKRFASALMWVIGYVFVGVPDSPSFRKGLGEGFCEPDEKLGRFLLNEIMTTGNMGHHDERVKVDTWSTALGRYR